MVASVFIATSTTAHVYARGESPVYPKRGSPANSLDRPYDGVGSGPGTHSAAPLRDCGYLPTMRDSNMAGPGRLEDY